MKKLIALLMAVMMVLGCVAAMADAGSEPAWADYDNMIATAKEQSLMGFMHTTWHTLSTGMPFVTRFMPLLKWAGRRQLILEKCYMLHVTCYIKVVSIFLS